VTRQQYEEEAIFAENERIPNIVEDCGSAICAEQSGIISYPDVLIDITIRQLT